METLQHATEGNDDRQREAELDIPSTQRNPLVEEGLQLYRTAEQDDFQDKATVEKCLKCFIQASENGDEEATSWIKSFLNSLSSMPPSLVVPSKLIQVMQLLTEATEEEKKIRVVARSMFSKMAGGEEYIAKEKIEESTTSILPSGYQKETPKVMRSIRRMMNDAMVTGGTKEVSLVIVL